MRRPHLITIALLSFFFLAPLHAGENAPSDPKRQAPKTKEDPLAQVIGVGGGSLRFDGTADIIGDPETGELVSMHITKGVVLSGEISLKCEDLMIDMKKNIMIATSKNGSRVEFAMEGISGHCGILTFEIDTKKTILDDNPFVREINEDGGVREIVGKRIMMTREGEANNIHVDGSAEFIFQPAAATTTSKEAPKKKPATRIDADNVEKIRRDPTIE